MKTRLLHTIFWRDGYILKLPPTARLLFLHYLTNEYIGMTGMFQEDVATVAFCTGLKEKEILEHNERFTADGKILFFKDWVCIVNAERHQNYTGEKNSVAYQKELSTIPPQAVDNFRERKEALKSLSDRVSIPYAYPIDTPIKSNSNSNPLEERGVGRETSPAAPKKSETPFHKTMDYLEAIPEEDQEAMAKKFNTSKEFIVAKGEALKNWCLSSGKVKKDYRAFLRVCLQGDAEKGKVPKAGQTHFSAQNMSKYDGL